MSTLYEELLISNHADQNELRAHYCRMAKEMHPDRNPINYERFIRVQGAYNVLKDPKKRFVYDLLGESSLNVFQDERATSLYTSFLTRVNVIAMYVVYFLITINFFAMPIFLYMWNIGIITKLVYTMSLFLISILTGNILAVKIIYKLKANKEFNYRYEIWRILIPCIITILFVLQLVVAFTAMDGTIKSYKYFYMMPYYLSELVHAVYTIRVRKEEGEERRGEYYKIGYITLTRVILSMLLYIPVNIPLKSFFLLGIVFVSLIMNGVNLRISIICTSILMFFIVACLNMMLETSLTALYFFWIPPFLIGVLGFAVMHKKMKETAAKSLFGRSKVPIECV